MAESKAKTEKIEREYTIPLRRKYQIVPRYKRTNKAIKAVKEFLVRHMKIRDRDLKKIKIDKYLNQVIWSRGIKKPPTKIKVRAIKEPEKDIVRVELVNIPEKLRFKKEKEAKLVKQAKEILENKKTMMQKIKESSKGTEKPSEEESPESKEEAKEKEKTSAEATKQIEKAEAKKAKHEAIASGKMRQPKHQQRKALQK